jgi:hypothetical protein
MEYSRQVIGTSSAAGGGVSFINIDSVVSTGISTAAAEAHIPICFPFIKFKTFTGLAIFMPLIHIQNSYQ